MNKEIQDKCYLIKWGGVAAKIVAPNVLSAVIRFLDKANLTMPHDSMKIKYSGLINGAKSWVVTNIGVSADDSQNMLFITGV